MENFSYYCAGASLTDLPFQNVDAILFNVMDNCATDAKLLKTEKLFKQSGATRTLLDSSGFGLLKAEIKNKEMSFDFSKRIRNGKDFNLSVEHVIEAYDRLKAIGIEPDEVVALDWPIKTIKNPDEQKAEFYR